ncbi:hypothetical protein G6F68_019381 [Rhizopus microsporus]|nr:hypothetical protein G6F68_019381 [Rhizopus microsporus]
MVSVMMNTTGHNRVPAVKLSEPGEDLHPDQLGQHRIAAEERGQHDEQQARAVLQWALDRRRGHSARSPARVNGTLDGATAPPEMMKLIAWSTVQSVGVSSSTGTISR